MPNHAPSCRLPPFVLIIIQVFFEITLFSDMILLLSLSKPQILRKPPEVCVPCQTLGNGLFGKVHADDFNKFSAR